MTEHRFGGPWTEEKLARLRKHLHAYMTIFSRNKRAAYLRAVYVDAFADTGFRKGPSSKDEVTDTLFDEVVSDTDADAWRKGSAHIALETVPPFAEYMFIEHAPGHAQELGRLRSLFPSLSERMRIVREEANEHLRKWCAGTDWNKTRAVVFLDPYGMQAEWATIAAMGATQGIDLWILFPLGVGANRLLWMGVSVEDSRVLARISDLRQVPAAVRFLSCEPLIGPLDQLPLDGIDWVIVGGESGPGARPMRPEWALSVLNQCRSRGVPFFFKQWGGTRKKATGRALDGRTYDEMPRRQAKESRAAAFPSSAEISGGLA